jgi:hypothetical protein
LISLSPAGHDRFPLLEFALILCFCAVPCLTRLLSRCPSDIPHLLSVSLMEHSVGVGREVRLWVLQPFFGRDDTKVEIGFLGIAVAVEE